MSDVDVLLDLLLAHIRTAQDWRMAGALLEEEGAWEEAEVTAHEILDLLEEGARPTEPPSEEWKDLGSVSEDVEALLDLISDELAGR